MIPRPLLWAWLAPFSIGSSVIAQEPIDLKSLLNDDTIGADWIYDDIEAGYAAAREDNKPLLVAFR